LIVRPICPALALDCVDGASPIGALAVWQLLAKAFNPINDHFCALIAIG